MGSLNASGISVVSKQPYTFRKHSVRIKRTDSRDDSESVLVDRYEDEHRTIGSGSIVREDGSVEYNEEVAWGVYRMGRSTLERVASDTGASRDRHVELGDNLTDAVLATGLGLKGENAQKHVGHTGNRVVIRQSVDDSLIERASDSGSFDS